MGFDTYNIGSIIPVVIPGYLTHEMFRLWRHDKLENENIGLFHQNGLSWCYAVSY